MDGNKTQQRDYTCTNATTGTWGTWYDIDVTGCSTSGGGSGLPLPPTPSASLSLPFSNVSCDCPGGGYANPGKCWAQPGSIYVSAVTHDSNCATSDPLYNLGSVKAVDSTINYSASDTFVISDPYMGSVTLTGVEAACASAGGKLNNSKTFCSIVEFEPASTSMANIFFSTAGWAQAQAQSSLDLVHYYTVLNPIVPTYDNICYCKNIWRGGQPWSVPWSN